MSELSNSKSYCGQLADYMAGLIIQLRRFYCPPGREIPVPPITFRLAVAARLWSTIGQKHAEPGLDKMGKQLGCLIDVWQEEPAAFPQKLHPAMEHLTYWLEGLIKRLDGGEPLSEIISDSGWHLILTFFCDAGTPQYVMNELEESLRRWENRFCNLDIETTQEEQLSERWQRLRNWGDALFPASENSADTNVAENRQSFTYSEPCRLLLLMESPFRRDHLSQKLFAIGQAPLICTSCDEVIQHCQSSPVQTFVLCDNLEPNNYLKTLQSCLNKVEDVVHPALLLVAGGSPGDSERQRQRALNLGASGVWSEPFDIGILAHLIGRDFS